MFLFKMSKAFYSIQCPVIAHWKKRSEALCESWDNYFCLYDQNKNSFTEFGKEKPKFDKPGNTFLFYCL